MSYDLRPRNKQLDCFTFGAFSWPWLLDAGAGTALGVCQGFKLASFIFTPDDKGRCPRYNDGYYVNGKLAKIVSFLSRNIASLQCSLNSEWEALDEESKKYFESVGRYPIREDFIEKAEKFAEWAEQSKGFWIY